MNKSKRLRILSFALTLTAAGLLFASLKLPLWQMRMEAPQYRDNEALKLAVYPGSLRGDLAEIKVLNQYIGVHIPEVLSQTRWLPTAFVVSGMLGVVAALLPGVARRRALVLIPWLLSIGLIAAAVQAQWQMYEIGHRRDQKTKLARVKDFTPPLLGKGRVAQFEIASSFGVGAWLVGAAIVLQFTGAWLNRPRGVAQNGETERTQSQSERDANATSPREALGVSPAPGTLRLGASRAP